MLIVLWRHFKKREEDERKKDLKMSEERREIYQRHTIAREKLHKSHVELVTEVTKALMDKNNTDDKMSEALKILASQLKEIQGMIRDNHE